MVGLSEKFAGPGLEDFDIYRNLGLDPHDKSSSINNIEDLKRLAKKAQMKLHPDRLNRMESSAPEGVDLATLNGLVDRLARCLHLQADAFIELKERAKDKWRSTWKITDEIGDWDPHGPSPYPKKRTRQMDAQYPTDSTTGSCPCERPPEPHVHCYAKNNTRSYSTRARPGDTEDDPIPVISDDEEEDVRLGLDEAHSVHLGDKKEDPIPIISDDDEEADPAAATSSIPPLADPRHYVGQFRAHMQHTNNRATFRYELSSQQLKELGERFVQSEQGNKNFSPIAVIGVVRKHGDHDTNAIPEYVVTACLGSNSVRLRVWNQDIRCQKLPDWVKGKRRSMVREDFGALGYQFSPFDHLTRNELETHLRSMVKE